MISEIDAAIRDYLLDGRLPPDVEPTSKTGVFYLGLINSIQETRALKATMPPMSPDRVQRVVALLYGAPRSEAQHVA